MTETSNSELNNRELHLEFILGNKSETRESPTNSKLALQLNKEVIDTSRNGEVSRNAQNIVEQKESIQTYSCEDCKKHFKNGEDFNNHSKTKAHANMIQQKLYTIKGPIHHRCEICDKQLGSTSSLGRHKRGVHGEACLKCPKCSSSFSRYDNLNKHVETVHEKKFKTQCQNCRKELCNKFTLQRHTKRCKISTSSELLNAKKL